MVEVGADIVNIPEKVKVLGATGLKATQ